MAGSNSWGPPLVDFSSIANLGDSFINAYDASQKRGRENERRKTLATLGQDFKSGDFGGAAQKLATLGDLQGAAQVYGLGLKMKESAREDEWLRNNAGILGGGFAPAASSGPATPTASVGNPNEIETRFISTVKQAGLTNPVGLAAVAAYGRAESGFSPQNVNRSWNDPSESGQAGTAGGIMSWRAERLQNLQNFARQRGEAQPSVETQALFLAQEDQSLIPKLQAAQTPQEANQIMANAWRFAGYNRPGGENARRLALTQNYAQRFGGQGGAPVAIPVQVAETEEDVQRLEAQQGNPVVNAPAPVQMAQAQSADMPAAGAPPAQGFAVPGAAQADAAIANDPRVINLQRALAGAPDKYKPSIQSRLNILVEELKAQRQQSAPTTSYRDYERARTDPSYREFLKEQRAQTNVNVGGGSDKQIFDALEKGSEAAQSAATGLQSIREARRAVEGGGYFGAGADIKLGLQKTAAAFGIASPETLGKIVNTETFRSAIAPQISATMKATVGSTQISNADREFAEKAAGGSISLDEKSIARLLGIMEKANRVIIDRHQKRLDTVYPEEGGKFARERALFGVQAPAEEEAPPQPQQRSQTAPSGAPTATGPNGQRVIWNGQAWVPMT
jgi:hypothetical protein